MALLDNHTQEGCNIPLPCGGAAYEGNGRKLAENGRYSEVTHAQVRPIQVYFRSFVFVQVVVYHYVEFPETTSGIGNFPDVVDNVVGLYRFCCLHHGVHDRLVCQA